MAHLQARKRQRELYHPAAGLPSCVLVTDKVVELEVAVSGLQVIVLDRVP